MYPTKPPSEDGTVNDTNWCHVDARLNDLVYRVSRLEAILAWKDDVYQEAIRNTTITFTPLELDEYVMKRVLEEREECAKIADDVSGEQLFYDAGAAADDIAGKIRARGKENGTA